MITTEPIDYTLQLEEIRDLLIEIRNDGRVNPFNEEEGEIPYGQIIYDAFYDYGILEEFDETTSTNIDVQYIDNRIDNIFSTIDALGTAILVFVTVIGLVVVAKYFTQGR